MVAVLALTGAVLFVTTGLALAARIVHIGNLDAMALAAKLALPHPSSAMDWPELEIRAVVPQPGDPSFVLVLVGRRRSGNEAATLLVELSGARDRSVQRLSGWCHSGAPITPMARADASVELRRRQSLDRVCGRLLAEDYGPPVPGAGRRPLPA